MDDMNARQLPQSWRTGDWQSISDSLGGATRQLRVAADSLTAGAPPGEPIGRLALYDESGAVVGFVAVFAP